MKNRFRKRLNRNSARRKVFKKGDSLGGWTLIEKIGVGGNGEVWKAEKDKNIAAIKTLHKVNSESYKRFKIEIDILISLKNMDGIIPLIESDFSSKLGNKTAWYAMPLAQSSNDFLKDKNAADITREFIRLAITLEDLHKRSISHRDIKPANILALNGRLCFSDFGLVKYPQREDLTPFKKDIGPKFFMAPEMRRSAATADGTAADVFSFSKTLWVALTKQSLAFDGQYTTASDVALKNYLKNIYTTTLDELLIDSTANTPSSRPSMSDIIIRLNRWLQLAEDFLQRNPIEWSELKNRLFPIAPPSSATWTDIKEITVVLNEMAKARSINHMFYPDGGGNTLTSAEIAGENGCIAIHSYGIYILSPVKLSYESIANFPLLNYFRIETKSLSKTGECEVPPTSRQEYLTEISTGVYASRDIWDYHDQTDAQPLPKTARPVTRILGGSFVIFSTRSPYNLNSATYDARHDKMSETVFRSYIDMLAKHLLANT